MKKIFACLVLYKAALCADFTALDMLAIKNLQSCGALDSHAGSLEVKFIDDDQEAYGVSWNLRQCPPADKKLWKAIHQRISEAGSNYALKANVEITSGVHKLQRYLQNTKIIGELECNIPMLTPELCTKLLPGNKPILWGVSIADAIFMENKPGSVTIRPQQLPYAVYYVPQTPATATSAGAKLHQQLQSEISELKETVQHLLQKTSTLEARIQLLNQSVTSLQAQILLQTETFSSSAEGEQPPAYDTVMDSNAQAPTS